jgi:hypothetical protein
MTEFNLDDFLAGVKEDRTKSTNSKDRVRKVSMNTKDTTGTLVFLPVMSPKSVRKFYTKVQGVREFYGETSQVKSGEGWYRILPIEWYDLNQEQTALYNEVIGYFDTVLDLRSGDVDSFNEVRMKTHSLFHGICLRFVNKNNAVVEKYIDSPCVFDYPSSMVIDSLETAIEAKNALATNRNWVLTYFNPNNTGRKGAIQVIYLPKSGGGVGYDCSVSFVANSDEGEVVDPNFTISDDIVKQFNDIIPYFLGWMYDWDNENYFNEIAFKELRDLLKIRIEQLKSIDMSQKPADEDKTFDNKNDLNQQVKTPF